MKLNDIIFAIGIIIITSLLIFVLYDDTIGSDFQTYIDEYDDSNLSEKINISEKDTKLMPTSVVNNTSNTELITKTRTSYSNLSTVSKKSKTRTSTVQSSNSPKDNPNNNIKRDSRDSKLSSFSNAPDNKVIRQNEPSKQKN